MLYKKMKEKKIQKNTSQLKSESPDETRVKILLEFDSSQNFKCAEYFF